MNERDFLEAIEAEPANPLPRLVYADWLDDQADPRGELLRIQEELRGIEVERRPAKEARMQELLRQGVEPLTILHEASIGLEDVLIFPGEFLMGSPPDEPGHADDEKQVKVQLTRAFGLGKYPVTQAEWHAIMGDQFGKEASRTLRNPGYPAMFIDWPDACRFCRKLTELEQQAGWLSEDWEYALPTEAQWEYACRAGSTTMYSCGADATELREHAWFDETTWVIGEERLHSVGQKQPNPWGLCDMHGNIWEWCKDSYEEILPGGIDPAVTTERKFHVTRGGFWRLSARDCRSAYRGKHQTDNSSQYLGFRVARVPVNC